MRTIEVKELAYLPLGRQGENRAQQIVWPGIADSWARRYGEGSFALTVKRQGDEAPYPASVRSENGDVVWTLNNADTAKAGEGLAELSYTVSGTVAKSKTWRTVTEPSLSADGTTEPPEPYQSWMDGIHQITESIKREEDERQAAEDGRTEAEEGRILAERARAEAEEARVAAEQGRVRSNRDIQTDEGERRKAERERAEAEGSRAFTETSRNRNEGERIEAEKDRAFKETTRVSGETARVTAETARAEAETARVNAETARAEEEKKRQSAEWQRNTSERSREDNEQHRMLWEAGRVLAEKARSVWEQYDATHDYKEGNKVAFGGSSYLCIKDCPASASAPPPDSTYWLLIAKKGADAFAIKLSEKDGTLSVDKNYGDILAACKAGGLVYVSKERKRPDGGVDGETIYSYSYYAEDDDGRGEICFVREGARLVIESDGRVTLSVFGTPHYDLDDAFALGDSIPKFDRYTDKLVPATPNVDYALPTLYVTITQDGQDSDGNPIYKSDKTYEEIKAAHDAGREVKIARSGVFGDEMLPALGIDNIRLDAIGEYSADFVGAGVPVLPPNEAPQTGGQIFSLIGVYVQKGEERVQVSFPVNLADGRPEWDEERIYKLPQQYLATVSMIASGELSSTTSFDDLKRIYEAYQAFEAPTGIAALCAQLTYPNGVISPIQRMVSFDGTTFVFQAVGADDLSTITLTKSNGKDVWVYESVPLGGDNSFKVTLTSKVSGGYDIDKTLNEVVKAYNDNKYVYALFQNKNDFEFLSLDEFLVPGVEGYALIAFSSEHRYIVFRSSGDSALMYDKSRSSDNGVRREAMPPVPVTAADNGKFLRVVDGQWAAEAVANAKGVSF